MFSLPGGLQAEHCPSDPGCSRSRTGILIPGCSQWPHCSPYRGFISLEDTSYVLEPTSDHADGAHWIYTAEHLRLATGTCGHDFNITSSVEDAVSSPFRTFSARVRVTLHLHPLIHLFKPSSKSSTFILFFWDEFAEWIDLRLPFTAISTSAFCWRTIKAVHIRGSVSVCLWTETRGRAQTCNTWTESGFKMSQLSAHFCTSPSVPAFLSSALCQRGSACTESSKLSPHPQENQF